MLGVGSGVGSGLGSGTLVGRADDDSFVVLPRLLAHLQQLGCVRHLCYGPMAYVGYKYGCNLRQPVAVRQP